MKKAFFFGQNAVDQTAPDYDGWAGLLQGCVPDARDLALAASAWLGFDSRAVLSGWNLGLTGPVPANQWRITLSATRQAWLTAHHDLQSQAQPGDLFLIGNSGHGYQYDTPFQFNGGQGFCFADGLFRDTQQFNLYCGWPAGVDVIYILDTCFSGGMDKDRPPGNRPAIRAMPAKPATKFPDPHPLMRSDAVQANILLLCAAAPDQTAADGPNNGAFTGTLLAVLDQALKAATPLTWRQLLDSTRDTMAGAFKQTPTLDILGGGSALADRPIPI